MNSYRGLSAAHVLWPYPRIMPTTCTAARGRDERVARAFAAELLAPAEGIRLTLDSIGQSDDSALETVAKHCRVSPLVVRHQYDNQIAISSSGG